ncbi:MAG: hypothetical protein AB1450_01460 [Pseudomonadota bacterium]
MNHALTALRNFWFPGARPEWTPAHRRFSYIAFATVVLFGLIIPEDIVVANSWAQKFTDFMAKIIPQIDNVSRVNLHSDTNRFLYSALWAVSPLFLPLVIKEQLNLIEVVDVEKKREIDWSLHLLRIFLLLLVSVFSLFWMSYRPTFYVSHFMFVNPIGRPIGAFLLVYGAVLPATYVTALILSIKRGTYPGK